MSGCRPGCALTPGQSTSWLKTRARLGTTAYFCKAVVLKKGTPEGAREKSDMHAIRAPPFRGASVYVARTSTTPPEGPAGVRTTSTETCVGWHNREKC